MRTLGKCFIALPFVVFGLLGLIFDPVDFLTALGILVLIAGPILLGLYLLGKA